MACQDRAYRLTYDDTTGFDDDYTRSTVVVITDNCGDANSVPTGLLWGDGSPITKTFRPLPIGFIHFRNKGD